MVTPLICGRFQDQEDDDFELLKSCSSLKKLTRKPRKWHSFGGRSGKLNKNPYADQGLDKYSALLAELDSKRQKIYTQKGSEDISLLGFVYSDSDHYKPIVIRLRDKKHQPNKMDNIFPEVSLEKSVTEQPKLVDQVKVMSRIVSGIKTAPRNMSFHMVKKNLSQPSYYLPSSSSKKSSTLKKTKMIKKVYGKTMSHNNTMIGDQNTRKRKPETMNKAISYNIKSINSIDHGLYSPKSVLNGYKSPPQVSPPHEHKF